MNSGWIWYNVGMSDKAKILEFVSFCVEMYANRNAFSGQEALSRFREHGVLDYLDGNYDALHTQGFRYILPMIDEYMSRQEAK